MFSIFILEYIFVFVLIVMLASRLTCFFPGFYFETPRPEVVIVAMNLTFAKTFGFCFRGFDAALIDLADWRKMAGLEVLYTCVAGSISCPQDAVVCFVHWEMIKSGYRSIGSGDEVSQIGYLCVAKGRVNSPNWCYNIKWAIIIDNHRTVLLVS